jgi:opacity protein-like surface antigen
MKRLIWGLAAASAVSLGATSATAAESNFYIAGNLGLFQHQDLGDAYGDELSFESGLYLSGAAGMDLGNGVRLEVELGSTSFDGDELDTGSGTLDASSVEASATLVTLGGYYDIQTQGSVSPYFGAGFGLASYTLEESGVELVDDTDLTAFGELGLNINASETVTIAPSYRYLWIDSGEYGIDDSTAHIFKLGARFAF